MKIMFCITALSMPEVWYSLEDQSVSPHDQKHHRDLIINTKFQIQTKQWAMRTQICVICRSFLIRSSFTFLASSLTRSLSPSAPGFVRNGRQSAKIQNFGVLFLFDLKFLGLTFHPLTFLFCLWGAGKEHIRLEKRPKFSFSDLGQTFDIWNCHVIS